MQANGRATVAASGDDVLGGALGRALRRPLLSVEQERALARRAGAGDIGARDRLVEANVRLVASIARGHRGRGVPYADLVQEGMMGLLRAIERFDPDRGHRLATYAAWWVRRRMLEAICAAPSIRLPAEGNRQLAAILKSERELSTHGRPRPDDDAVARRTGIPLQRVQRLRAAAHVVASLDAQAPGAERPLIELLTDGAAPCIASALDRNETRRAVHAAMATLAPRVRAVLVLRFGLDGGDGLTHDQIGGRLGITAERCRQIEAEGLRRLRPLAERASLAA